jgi:hypothetical protein
LDPTAQLQGDMFPETISIVQRIHMAATRHFGAGATGRMTREQLQRQLENDADGKLGAKSSLSSIDRAVRDYGPQGTMVKHAMPWPLTRRAWRAWSVPRESDSGPAELRPVSPILIWHAFDEHGQRITCRGWIGSDGLWHAA